MCTFHKLSIFENNMKHYIIKCGQYDLKCHGNSEWNAHGELRKGDLVEMEGIQGRRESIPDHASM